MARRVAAVACGRARLDRICGVLFSGLGDGSVVIA
jgi:hypothetical protein